MAGRRPVVLRGAASELVDHVGAPLWSAANLGWLLPRGKVRVSPSATFTFCREQHPLCASGAMPPPSRVLEMRGDEFVRRITRTITHTGGRPPDALAYEADESERYYLQADVPEALLRAERDVPPLWRALGVQQAQPLRLWASTHGASTPLHFDLAHSFLAQVRSPGLLRTAPKCPDAISLITQVRSP